MPVIILPTLLHAEPSVCFDLSRSIDLHQRSMAHTKERAVAGQTTGLIGLHQTVRWKAVHFGVAWSMTVQITQFDFPHTFTDEMVSGPFAMMRHKHIFEKKGEYTLMTDQFEYTSPLGWLGRLADKLFLERYMLGLLERRNRVIKSGCDG